MATRATGAFLACARTKRPGTVRITGVSINHLDRMLFPEQGLTKQALAGFYLAAIQLGVLKLHPCGSVADRLKRSDWLILDLNPAPHVDFDRVKHTAEVVPRLDLEAFVKTIGGTVLHMVAPLAWEEFDALTGGGAWTMANFAACMAQGRRAERAGRNARRGPLSRAAASPLPSRRHRTTHAKHWTASFHCFA